jgi:hypothetical protein
MLDMSPPVDALFNGYSGIGLLDLSGAALLDFLVPIFLTKLSSLVWSWQ